MRIVPTNSGVVLTMDSRGPNDPHAEGTVVAVGGGVPWLKQGDRAMFPMADATEVRVTPGSYEGIEMPTYGQCNTPSYALVYLLDQCSVHAVIHA